jgi:uncharacterized protein
MSPRIDLDRAKIVDFCKRWNVSELALFGSVLRDDFTQGSDVDVMVTFAPGTSIGLIAFSKMQLELSEIIGRNVDLVTKGGLRPLIKDEVLAQSETLYAA